MQRTLCKCKLNGNFAVCDKQGAQSFSFRIVLMGGFEGIVERAPTSGSKITRDERAASVEKATENVRTSAKAWHSSMSLLCTRLSCAIDISQRK